MSKHGKLTASLRKAQDNRDGAPHPSFGIRHSKIGIHTTRLLLIALLFSFGCTASFVPRAFEAPTQHRLSDFTFTKLTAVHAAMDYEAVMESRQELRILFGGDWPADTFSLAQNKADIALHEQLFDERTSFTYSIVNRAGNRVIGCMYINPTDAPEYDAQVHLWVRTSELAQEATVRDAATVWLASGWPFRHVQFHW